MQRPGPDADSAPSASEPAAAAPAVETEPAVTPPAAESANETQPACAETEPEATHAAEVTATEPEVIESRAEAIESERRGTEREVLVRDAPHGRAMGYCWKEKAQPARGGRAHRRRPSAGLAWCWPSQGLHSLEMLALRVCRNLMGHAQRYEFDRSATK